MTGDLETRGLGRRCADGYLRLIDQTLLPTEFVEIDCRDVPTRLGGDRRSGSAVRRRSAIAAAYGAVLGGQAAVERGDAARSAGPARRRRLSADQPAHGRQPVLGARPDRTRDRRRERGHDAAGRSERLLDEAHAIADEDRAMCRAIGRHGAELSRPAQGVLTHCNAGGLATADYGTALAVIFSAHEQGKDVHVFADETRPLLQGARLTAWELQRRGVEVTLICDSMAAQVMKEGKVQMVVVGADRIAANGDTANKIGTYGVALLAQAHGIPFYVAAPSSTFDLTLADGTAIPIEQRDPQRGHPRLRPPDRPRGGGRLQPRLRRHPGRPHRRHHHRTRRDPAGQRANDPRRARGGQVGPGGVRPIRPTLTSSTSSGFETPRGRVTSGRGPAGATGDRVEALAGGDVRTTAPKS